MIEQAKKKAEGVLDAVKRKAEELRNAKLEEIKEHVENSSKQDLAEKKVACHRQLQNLKSQIIDDVFKNANGELQQYVKNRAYLGTLSNLIIESGIALGGGKLRIGLNEPDRKRISRDLLKKLSLIISEKTGVSTEAVLDEKIVRAIGGVELSTTDQKASVDNTLEARLERIKEDAKAELEAILFK